MFGCMDGFEFLLSDGGVGDATTITSIESQAWIGCWRTAISNNIVAETTMTIIPVCLCLSHFNLRHEEQSATLSLAPHA